MATTIPSIQEALRQEPGHYVVETQATTLASGQPLTFVSYGLRGARPGQRVGVRSRLHGDEFATAELVLSFLDLLPIADLTGTLLLIPIANAPSREAATRSTLHDMANLNRVFPGNPRGTVTEMLAHALTEHVAAVCDVLFDLHSEPETMGIRCFPVAAPAEDYGRRAFALAKASGCPTEGPVD